MEIKQDIEKRELKKEIEKLRDENKEYVKELLIMLRKKKHAARDDDAIIKLFGERISANDRQITEKEKQITELIKNQGKITAPRFAIYFANNLLTFVVCLIGNNGRRQWALESHYHSWSFVGLGPRHNIRELAFCLASRMDTDCNQPMRQTILIPPPCRE